MNNFFLWSIAVLVLVGTYDIGYAVEDAYEINKGFYDYVGNYHEPKGTIWQICTAYINDANKWIRALADEIDKIRSGKAIVLGMSKESAIAHLNDELSFWRVELSFWWRMLYRAIDNGY